MIIGNLIIKKAHISWVAGQDGDYLAGLDMTAVPMGSATGRATASSCWCGTVRGCGSVVGACTGDGLPGHEETNGSGG